MALAIFDLDHTLINGDSDHAWGKFLIEKGLVDADSYGARNDQFYEDYKSGNLDINAYQEFVLAPMTAFTMDEIAALHREFMTTHILAMRLPKAAQLLDRHRRDGDFLLIITATNYFITAPIAAAMGVPDIIATEGEIRNGRFTGRIKGTPCFAEGKVKRLQEWLGSSEQSLSGSYFYTDSHNDIPLLQLVTHPVAVDPDEPLRRFAERMHWPQLSLR